MTRWPTKSLIEICERVTDGSHRTPPFTAAGYPFVTVAHVDPAGRIDFSACKRISVADFEDLKKNDCRPLPGDVLFSKDGTVGKTAVIDFDTDFVVLSSLAILRPNRTLLHERFLAYALRSEPVLSQAIHRKSGAAIRRIVLRDLCQVSMPVPPLAEQERIVKLLDEAAEMRKLRARADHRTADLVPALFHEMFGETGPQCLTVTIEDAVEKFIDYRGKTPPKSLSGVPLVTARIVKGGRILPANEFIREEIYDEWMRRGLPRVGDVLFTMEAPLGEVAIVHDVRIALAQRILLMRPRADLLDSRYFMTALKLPTVWKQIEERANSTTVRGIRQAELRKVRIPVPPLPLQEEFARLVTEIRAMETEQASSSRRLEDLFQSLLHRAFRGEL